MTVTVNNFVRRQKKNSGKTYSLKLSFEDIAQHAENQMINGDFIEGYREGVRVVFAKETIINNFICPFVKIDQNTKLNASFVVRQDGEEPYIKVTASSGLPLKTGAVEIICYHKDVLKENNENSADGDWELISFHAIPREVEAMPMGPVTMMRNQLDLKGGTKAHYKSQSWAESVRFWQKYAPLEKI